MTQTHYASRIILASPRAIFRALIDPSSIVLWRPPQGMSARIEAFDPRPGGKYRMELIYDDGSYGKSRPGVDVITGEILELIPDQRIVEAVCFETDDPSYFGEMMIETNLTPDRDGTRVSIVATNVPVGINEKDHRQGMDSTLKNLATFIEL